MKVLLIIYLISIVYYFISLILLTVILVHQAREENLKLKKMSVAEKIRAYLRLALLAVIPVFNIILGTVFLFSNTLQTTLMESLREESIS
jgi:hypothetical protein